MTRGVAYLCVTLYCVFFFSSGKAGLPDPELLVDRLFKRRTFRPDPQGTNLMFAFFAQHFTHQFFKTYNRMGLGFTRALGHGVRRCSAFKLLMKNVVVWNICSRTPDGFTRHNPTHTLWTL